MAQEEARPISHRDIPRGARLHLQRKLRGLSAEKLAELAKTSPAMIYKYERLDLVDDPRRTADPTGAVLARLAAVLEVSVDYLVGASDIPHKGTRLTRQRSPRQNARSDRPVQGSILVSAVR